MILLDIILLITRLILLMGRKLFFFKIMVKVNRPIQLWRTNCNTCRCVVSSKLYCRLCFESFCFDCVVFSQRHFVCPNPNHFRRYGGIGIQVCCKCQSCRFLRRQCHSIQRICNFQRYCRKCKVEFGQFVGR